MQSTSQTSPPRKLKRLWFKDGSMVFQAENSLFRLYPGILASHSSVFRDMFSFPQPAQKQQHRSDRTPDVLLYDSAIDAQRFFRAIFEPEYFLPPPAQVSLETVASVLRLSTKYDVPHLRKRALLHLSNSYPTTLSGFDARLTARTIPFRQNAPFVVAMLARELDAPWLLPSALYCICIRPYDTFFSPIPLPSSSSSKPDPKNALCLDTAMQKTCVLGRDALIKAHNHDLYAFLRTPLPISSRCLSDPKNRSCPSSPSSSPIRSSPPSSPWSVLLSSSSSEGEGEEPAKSSPCTLARLSWADETLSDEACYPLSKSDFDWPAFKDHSGVCEVCFEECKKRYDDARRALWDSLPDLFGLAAGGGWDALRRMEREELERGSELDFTSDDSEEDDEEEAGEGWDEEEGYASSSSGTTNSLRSLSVC